MITKNELTPFLNKLAENQTRTIGEACAAANNLIRQYNARTDPSKQMGEFTAAYARDFFDASTFKDILKP
jgi:hypothetical protein